MQSRLEQLGKRVLEKKRQRVELRIEEDCGAWYLHSLIESGGIKRVVPVTVPQKEIIDLCILYRKNMDDFTLVYLAGDQIRSLRSLRTRISDSIP